MMINWRYKEKIVVSLLLSILILSNMKIVKADGSLYGICVLSSGKVVDYDGTGATGSNCEEVHNSNTWIGHYSNTTIVIRVVGGGDFTYYDYDSTFRYILRNLKWNIRLYIRRNADFPWMLVKNWSGIVLRYESSTITEKIFANYAYRIPYGFYDFKVDAYLSGNLTVTVRNGEGAAYSIIWVYCPLEEKHESLLGVYVDSYPFSINVTYSGEGSSGKYHGTRFTPFWIQENKIEDPGKGISKLKLNFTFSSMKIAGTKIYVLTRVDLFYRRRGRWQYLGSFHSSFLRVSLFWGRAVSCYKVEDLSGEEVIKGKTHGNILLKLRAVYNKTPSSILYVDTQPIKVNVTANSIEKQPPFSLVNTSGKIVVNLTVPRKYTLFKNIDPRWSHKLRERNNFVYDIFLVKNVDRNVETSQTKELKGEYEISFQYTVLTRNTKLQLLRNSTVIGSWCGKGRIDGIRLRLHNEKLILRISTRGFTGAVIVRNIIMKKLNHYFFARWKIFDDETLIDTFVASDIRITVPIEKAYKAIAYFVADEKTANISLTSEFYFQGEFIKLTSIEAGIYRIFSSPLYPNLHPPKLCVLALSENLTPVYFELDNLTLKVKRRYTFEATYLKRLDTEIFPIILEGKYKGYHFVGVTAWDPYLKYDLTNIFKNHTTYAVYNLTILNLNSSKRNTCYIVITSPRIRLSVVYHEKGVTFIWNASLAYFPPNITLTTNKIQKQFTFTLEADNRVIYTATNRNGVGLLNLTYNQLRDLLSYTDRKITANARWSSMLNFNSIGSDIKIVPYTLWLKYVRFKPFMLKVFTVRYKNFEILSVVLEKIIVYVDECPLEVVITERPPEYVIESSQRINPRESITILPIPKKTVNMILIPIVAKL